MTAIDNQNDIFATMVRKLMNCSRFVGKPEVRCDHTHLNPRQIGWWQSPTVERSQQGFLRLPD